MSATNTIRSPLCLLLLLAFSAAHAQSGDHVAIEETILLNDSGAVSSEVLANTRGKQGFDTLQQLNDNDQRAWLEDNELDSELTGNNVIENGALQGIEGISTIIQNTGNQVVIQESTLLNLTVTP